MADEYKLVEQVKLQHRFNSMSDDQINLAIADASLLVNSLQLPNSVAPQATRLYACHLLLAQDVANDGVVSETMGPLAHTYSDWSQMNDPYLLEFNKLLDDYGYNRNKGRVWTAD